MNFYPHNIGDYMAATAHLSELEDLYYRRLLEIYYTREEPIPGDVERACKLVRAQSPAAKKAVAAVLGEFFERTDRGWANARCDEEIERVNGKKAKAKASADKRWGNAKHDANGMRTHVPTHMRTHCEGNAPNPNPNPNPKQRQAASEVLEAEPVDNSASGPPPPMPPACPAEPSERKTDPPAEAVPHIAEPASRRGRVCNLLRQAGVRCGPTSAGIDEIANEPAITDEVLTQALVMLNERDGAGTFGARLVHLKAVEILKGPRRQKGPASEFPGWRTDDRQCDRLGQLLKLTPHRGEDYVAFRSRIDAKLREISERVAA